MRLRDQVVYILFAAILTIVIHDIFFIIYNRIPTSKKKRELWLSKLAREHSIAVKIVNIVAIIVIIFSVIFFNTSLQLPTYVNNLELPQTPTLTPTIAPTPGSTLAPAPTPAFETQSQLDTILTKIEKETCVAKFVNEHPVASVILAFIYTVLAILESIGKFISFTVRHIYSITKHIYIRVSKPTPEPTVGPQPQADMDSKQIESEVKSWLPEFYRLIRNIEMCIGQFFNKHDAFFKGIVTIASILIIVMFFGFLRNKQDTEVFGPEPTPEPMPTPTVTITSEPQSSDSVLPDSEPVLAPTPIMPAPMPIATASVPTELTPTPTSAPTELTPTPESVSPRTPTPVPTERTPTPAPISPRTPKTTPMPEPPAPLPMQDDSQSTSSTVATPLVPTYQVMLTINYSTSDGVKLKETTGTYIAGSIIKLEPPTGYVIDGGENTYKIPNENSKLTNFTIKAQAPHEFEKPKYEDGYQQSWQPAPMEFVIGDKKFNTQIQMAFIEDYNYLKLRDLEKMFSGTEKEFNIRYNLHQPHENVLVFTNIIRIVQKGDDQSGEAEQTYAPSPQGVATFRRQDIKYKNQIYSLNLYNIDDHIYVRLRDLGKLFAFELHYAPDTQTITITW